MFKVGDKIRVLHDNADEAEVSAGDEFIIRDVDPDGEEGWIEVDGDINWWFAFENIEIVKE